MIKPKVGSLTIWSGLWLLTEFTKEMGKANNETILTVSIMLLSQQDRHHCMILKDVLITQCGNDTINLKDEFQWQ